MFAAIRYTGDLSGLVSSNRTNDGVRLSGNTVCGTFDVGSSLGALVLSLAC